MNTKDNGKKPEWFFRKMKLGDFLKKVAFFEEVNLVTLPAVAAVIAVARFEFCTYLPEIPVVTRRMASNTNQDGLTF